MFLSGKDKEWSAEELEAASEALGYGAVKYVHQHCLLLTKIVNITTTRHFTSTFNRDSYCSLIYTSYLSIALIYLAFVTRFQFNI